MKKKDMTDKDLKQKLLDKLKFEQKRYEKHLLSMSKKKIMEQSFEYQTRKYICIELTFRKFNNDEEMEILIETNNLIEKIFNSFIPFETDHQAEQINNEISFFIANEMYKKHFDDPF